MGHVTKFSDHNSKVSAPESIRSWGSSVTGFVLEENNSVVCNFAVQKGHI